MKELRISKGGGRYRIVVAPGPAEKARLRALLPRLAETERREARRAGTAAVAQGFIVGRSPVTNAARHIGPYRVTLAADLESWFDTITRDQVAAALRAAGEDPALADQVTVGGVARQGLPTSPTIANLCAIPMDRAILNGLPAGAVYTRYADDLTVSLREDDPAQIERVRQLLQASAEAQGWRIAPQKWQLYRAAAGRRIVTGVSVGGRDLRLPREARRRLRAARHADPQSRATRGLEEWSRLKLPRAARPQRRIAGGFGGVVLNEQPRTQTPVPTANQAEHLVGGRRIRISGQ